FNRDLDAGVLRLELADILTEIRHLGLDRPHRPERNFSGRGGDRDPRPDKYCHQGGQDEGPTGLPLRCANHWDPPPGVGCKPNGVAVIQARRSSGLLGCATFGPRMSAAWAPLAGLRDVR